MLTYGKKKFCIQCSFLFADDDIKTNDLELYFCKVFWYKCFCKKLYFGYCNLFIRKDLLERYLLEKIKSFIGHLQFMVGQTHNLIGYLILPWAFPVGQNVMSDMFFVWLDIVWCPTLILRSVFTLYMYRTY